MSRTTPPGPLTYRVQARHDAGPEHGRTRENREERRRVQRHRAVVELMREIAARTSVQG